MENLADYQSKHHPGAHHTAVRPYYLHEKNSPLKQLLLYRIQLQRGVTYINQILHYPNEPRLQQSPTNSSNDSTGNTKSNKISLQPFKIFGKFN